MPNLVEVGIGPDEHVKRGVLLAHPLAAPSAARAGRPFRLARIQFPRVAGETCAVAHFAGPTQVGGSVGKLGIYRSQAQALQYQTHHGHQVRLHRRVCGVCNGRINVFLQS